MGAGRSESIYCILEWLKNPIPKNFMIRSRSGVGGFKFQPWPSTEKYIDPLLPLQLQRAAGIVSYLFVIFFTIIIN